MKGQISIEFMALLAIALLASSVLVAEMNERATQYSVSSSYNEADRLARKVSYTFDYLAANGNSSLELDFSPSLKEDYTIEIEDGQTVVKFNSRLATFPTTYNESKIVLNSTKDYTVSYNGSYSIKS